MSGLYLHIPFCRRKCPYCDFYSVVATKARLDDYPQLLTQHLAWAADHGWAGPFDTVYFGGGTPSLLTPAAIDLILQHIEQSFGLSRNAEITLEANPGTVTQQNLIGYREAGVNRLSLGLQSCNDKQLCNLGRLHDCKTGLEAFRSARSAGFDNISLDLMFALPGQTRTDLEEELHSYLELRPEHLSCYGLTAEPGTPFRKSVVSGQVSMPDEDFYADAFMLIHERLIDAGFEHYEIANYAQPGLACKHNLGYWQRQPYLGVGAGAHSFRADSWGSRWEIPPDLAAYQQALQQQQEPMSCLETFDRESALSETIYLAMRTRRGIHDAELLRRFDTTLSEAFPGAVSTGEEWLENINGNWTFTPAGWLLFDHLIMPFL